MRYNGYSDHLVSDTCGCCDIYVSSNGCQFDYKHISPWDMAERCLCDEWDGISLGICSGLGASDSYQNEAIMQGYRAAFWTIFSSAALVVFFVFYGLRKGGAVGKKND